MARPPRQHQASQTAQDQTEEYFILDDNAREVAGKKIPVDDKGKRAATVRLTPAEAAFHIAGGVISTSDPKQNKAAQEAMDMAEGEAPAHAKKK